MYTFLLIMYLVITIVMIIVILLQSGKGGMGSIGGGSSTGSVFGGSGSDMFLNKLTAYLALGFVGLSIILVQFTTKPKSSLAEKYASQAKTTVNEKAALKAGEAKKNLEKKVEDAKKAVKKKAEDSKKAAEEK